MLSKIEVAYLAILRIVLLVAATIALLVTVVATASALPAIGKVLGVSTAEPPKGATLREYIESKHVTEVDASDYSDESTDLSPQETALPSDVAEASRNFARYDARNGGVQATQQQWDDIFRAVLKDGVPANLHDAYGADVLRLSEQIVKSKGRPLSDARVLELLEFHRAKFLENAAAADSAKAADAAASMAKLVLAGGAFLVFILILFNFIFVKIERNLRRSSRDEAAA